MPKILISDAMDNIASEILLKNNLDVETKTNLTPDELKNIIANYDGLIVRSATKVTDDIIEVATNLKIIGRAGAGVDNINVEAAKSKNIIVMNTPGGNTNATAEHTIGLIFALLRKIPSANETTHRGLWEKKKMKGNELKGKKIGIVGFGNVGKRVAEISNALGMKVSIYSSYFNSVKDDLATVIVEPIAGNMGFVPGTKKFLQTIRTYTESNNSLLIFDEVMSGFRVSLGGAQEIYNIKPDLTALGKVIGGGLPVGAFGGKKEIMNYLAPEGPVYQAGTLSGNPLAMAAGATLLNLLIAQNPYKVLEEKAKLLLDEMKEIMISAGIPFSTNQIGGMFGFFFSEKLPKNIDDVSKTNDEVFSSFINACIGNGIYFAPSKYEAGFISATHGDAEIDKTLEVINKIVKTGEINK